MSQATSASVAPRLPGHLGATPHLSMEEAFTVVRRYPRRRPTGA